MGHSNNVPLFTALWSPLVGIWGILKGSWGVLVVIGLVSLLTYRRSNLHKAS